MSLLTPVNSEKKDSYIGIRVPAGLKDQFIAHIESIGSGLSLNTALIQLMQRELAESSKDKPKAPATGTVTTKKKKTARRK